MNTNEQTIHQMGLGISSLVKQATGRESVSNIEMDWVSVEQLARYIYGSGSGDVVSFNTNIPDAIESLIAYITAVQDLHGYDNPWPAGGGKNLLNDSERTFENSNIYFGGATNQSVESLILPAGTYTYSVVTADGTSTNLYLKDLDAGTQVSGFPAYSESSKTFTLENTTSLCAWVYKSGYSSVNEIKTAQIERGETPTAYAPYSNICPITGWTGCIVYHLGKNLCQGQEAGKMNNSTGEDEPASATYRTKGYIPVFPGKKYTISGFLESQQNQIRLFLYDKEQTYISNSVINIITNPTITIADGIYYIRFQASDTMMDGDTPVQVEVGESATAFEEYQEETYAFTFPDEAGTVYGGMLDVLTGLLTVTMAYIELSSLSWSVQGTGNDGGHVFASAGLSNKKQNPYAICTAYSIYNNSSWAATKINTFNLGHGSVSILGSSSTITDGPTYKSSLSGVYLAYEIATPVTYQLTAQEVTALIGQNNIFAYTGNVSVQYKVKEDLV